MRWVWTQMQHGRSNLTKGPLLKTLQTEKPIPKQEPETETGETAWTSKGEGKGNAIYRHWG